MPDSLDWTRFWCPLGGSVTLDDAFLLDPTTQAGQLVNKHLVSTSDLPHGPVLVLLGEAGSGKSNELKELSGSEFIELGTFSETELVEELDQRLDTCDVLYLDALDEALLGIPKACEIIIRRLHRATKRPNRLVITCRTAAWPESMSASLANLYGKKSLDILELVMLRREDVNTAAMARGLDAEAFLAAIESRGVEPLASNPVTLFLLLELFGGEQLPSTKVKVYERGLLKLCEQTRVRQRRSPIRDGGTTLSADDLLAVCLRIGALSTLSGRAIIDDSEGTPATSSLTVRDISGGSEYAGSDEVHVSEEAVRAALRHTALFSARGVSKYGFAHRSYAEYLAARFLHEAHFNGQQLRSILYGTEAENRRVAPQLQETAAWLADIDADIRNRLLQEEPGTLLRSDVGAQTPEFKRALAAALLDEIREGRAADLHDAVRTEERRFGDIFTTSKLLRRLADPGLVDLLKSTITNTEEPDSVRDAAIDIAEATGAVACANTCADAALDQAATLRLRVSAAHAVNRLGDTAAQDRLKPLALGLAGSDPDDDLKGCGLTATWPQSLSPAELLSCLSRPRGSRHIGSYHMFLSDEHLLDAFPVGALPDALRWAMEHVESDLREADLARVASAIAYKAWLHLDAPGVLPALTSLVLYRVQRHTLLMRLPADVYQSSGAQSHEQALIHLFQSDQRRRRALLTACLHQVDPPDQARRLGWPPLAFPEDFEWALEMACTAPEPESERFANLARGLCIFVGTGPLGNPKHMELWLKAREKSEVVRRVLNWPTEITVDSDEARSQRREFDEERAREHRYAEERERRRPKISRGEHIDILIRRCLEVDVRWYPRLYHDLAFDDAWKWHWHRNATQLKGWVLSPEPVRQRILDCAFRYLTECPTRRREVGPKEPILGADACAAAAIALWAARRDAMPSISHARWRAIAAPLVEGLSIASGDDRPSIRQIFRLVLKHARGPVCRKVVELVEAGRDQPFLHGVIELFGDSFPRRLLAHLLELAQTTLRTTPLMTGLLPWLVRRKVAGAGNFAASLVPKAAPIDDGSKRLAIIGARSLLAARRVQGWSIVWQSICTDLEWGDVL